MSEAASSSSSAPAPGSSRPAQKDAATEDIERLLSREATAFQREIEVERILKAFKLKCVLVSSLYSPRCARHIDRAYSPYEMLDIHEDATPEEIKKKYRQLSLCEHPALPPAPAALARECILTTPCACLITSHSS